MKNTLLLLGICSILLILLHEFNADSPHSDRPEETEEFDTMIIEPAPINSLSIRFPDPVIKIRKKKGKPCDEKMLINHFLRISTQMSRANIQYNSGPFTDCSGIFLQFADSITSYCSNFKGPDKSKYRSSRDIGRWYHEQKKLKLIKNPLKQDDVIRPGTVMFYGGRNAKSKNLKMDKLFASGGINHIGVVVEVSYEDGCVSSYSLFHGRSPGKPAAITTYHNRDNGNTKLPPYGNGTEPWLAYAYLY